MEYNDFDEVSINQLLADASKLRTINPHASIQLAQKAYQQAIELQAADLELKSIHLICSASLFDSELPEPSSWLDLLKKRSIELNKPSYQGMSLIQRSRWSYKRNQFSQSVEYLLQALKYFDPDNDILNMADCYNSLGKLYFDSGENDKAYEYYLKARPFVSKLPIGFHVGLEQNIGAVLLVQKKYADAYNIFQDLLAQVPSTELVAKTNLLQNLGQICQLTGEYDDALDYFKQALEIKKKADMKQEIIRTHCCIANIYVDYRKPELAFEYLQRASDLLHEKNLLEHICLYKSYINYFAYINDSDNKNLYEQKLISTQNQIDEADALTRGASKRI